MDLKEAKKIIAYARKSGIKSLTLGDLQVTFNDAVIFPARARAAAPTPTTEAKPTPAPTPVPTLDDINKWIYQDADEAH